jgi:hypothetical protein
VHLKLRVVAKAVGIDTKRRATVNNSATNCTTPLIISSGWMNKIFQQRNLLALHTRDSPSRKKESGECPCTQSSSPSVRRLYFYFGALACADKLAQFLLLGMPGAEAEKKSFLRELFLSLFLGLFSGARSILLSPK